MMGQMTFQMGSCLRRDSHWCKFKAPNRSLPQTRPKIARCGRGVTVLGPSQNARKQLSGMQGEMIDALDKATAELNEHDEWCEAEIGAIVAEINNAKDIITARTEQFDKASAFHNGMLIEHGRELQIKTDLCKELREVFKQCYDYLKEKEREMCGLMKIRQSVYNKVKNPDSSKPQLLIDDCMMSAWTVGPCSETCLGPNGEGVQIITRHKMSDWDPTTAEGKYGSTCPPGVVDRNCATVPCPIDCQMGP